MTTKQFLSIFMFLISFQCSSQNFNNLATDKWNEDILYLKKNLPKKHLNLFHSISETTFNAQIDELLNETHNMNSSQIYVEIAKILAQVGDGHTFARVANQFKRFPINWFWFKDGLRVVKTNEENRNLLGLKLISIDGIELEEIKRRLFSMSTDNEGELSQYFFASYFLNIPEVLHGLGITKEMNAAKFEFENADGNILSVLINAQNTDSYFSEKHYLAYNPVPLFLKSTESLSFEILNNNVLYINFKSYPKSIKSFARKIESVIKKKDIKKLIIDFRLNTGGNYKKGLQLIEKIKNTGFHQYGQTYVLIGRATISAAMSNTCHFKEKLNAILVGEPTGSRPISYSENDEIFLPYSKLEISYSTKFYKFQEEDTKGVYPDVRIDPNYEELKAGYDSVLQWVLKQKK